MSNEENNYKGFALFNEIEDRELRLRNRAVVMTNIAEDHSNKSKMISINGMGLIMGYFKSIPSDERNDQLNLFTQHMKERGFVLVTQ